MNINLMFLVLYFVKVSYSEEMSGIITDNDISNAMNKLVASRNQVTKYYSIPGKDLMCYIRKICVEVLRLGMLEVAQYLKLQ